MDVRLLHLNKPVSQSVSSSNILSPDQIRAQIWPNGVREDDLLGGMCKATEMYRSEVKCQFSCMAQTVHSKRTGTSAKSSSVVSLCRRL